MRRASVIVFVAAAAVTLSLAAIGSSAVASQTAAAPRPQYARSSPGDIGDPSSARTRTALLQPGWQTSPDELWTLRGDSTGLHLLAATASSAYAWHTVATLGDAAVETDRWVGNACLTGSGRYAVVAYAPRSFTNQEQLYLRGASVAVVDMRSGAVRKLGVSGSLAYYDPGCGTGSSAVVTATRFAEEHDGYTATRFFRVDASSGTVARPVELPGQYSSAVPIGTDIAAVRGSSLVRISDVGLVQPLVRGAAGAFDLAVDAQGGISYLSGSIDLNRVMRLPSLSSRVPEVIASRRGAWMGIQRGTAGRVFVLDPGFPSRSLGHGVTLIDASPHNEVSTLGQAMIVHSVMPSPSTAASAWRRAQTGDTSSVGGTLLRLDVEIRATQKHLPFTIEPRAYAPAAGASPPDTSSRLSGAAPTAVTAQALTASVTGTTDSSPTCAVPRNDPNTLVYQPTPRQVEWAADQAVVGNLMTARPTNWKGSGLASWTPQKLFPNPVLHGGGRVPVQILLGILAQESNLWQASGHALSGEFGNPLVADYYGRGATWSINYSAADCGYGIGQITDGMRKGAMALSTQRAVALDYETNIAAALQILVSKWNQTRDAGLIHSSGDPSSIENWIYAIWAYNSGFHAKGADPAGWGVGWFNNPANPIYPANRGFFNADPADAAHPANWPYEEKVIGWAAYSISTPDGPGFRAAWWATDTDRTAAKPWIFEFCDASNSCTPGAAQPCPTLDAHCYWNKPVTYNNCAAGYCGHELLRFDTSYPEQPDGTHYPPDCTLNGLPTGSLIVDDVANTYKSPEPGCGHPWANKGSFTLTFSSASGRIDFHQLAGGFGGHFWFAHTRTQSEDSGALAVTGKWAFTTSLANKWGRVFIHLPDHGAETQQAAYTVNLGNGTGQTRTLLQRVQSNAWVPLGVFNFKGYPSISLSSQTHDGTGSDDIAFDAVAIQPLTAKPKDFVVALGDSYASGEGASDDNGNDYYKETNYGGGLPNDGGRNACHRSPYSWSRKMALADSASPVGERAGGWDPALDYHLLACSGATTANLLPYYSVPVGSSPPTNAFGQQGQGQYGEVSQLDAGYLDSNTTLVTLSIGGNDAYFGPVITDCVNPTSGSCVDANTTGLGPNSTAIPGLINNQVKASVMTVIGQIHSKAPNAAILLMGYPELISNGASCMSTVGMGSDEATWIDQMSDVMDAALNSDVVAQHGQGVKIAFGDPTSDFAGKGVCGNPGDIHGVVVTRTAGDVPFSLSNPASQQSFHPTIDGTTLYAAAANRALRQLGL